MIWSPPASSCLRCPIQKTHTHTHAHTHVNTHRNYSNILTWIHSQSYIHRPVLVCVCMTVNDMVPIHGNSCLKYEHLIREYNHHSPHIVRLGQTTVMAWLYLEPWSNFQTQAWRFHCFGWFPRALPVPRWRVWGHRAACSMHPVADCRPDCCRTPRPLGPPRHQSVSADPEPLDTPLLCRNKSFCT